MCVGLDGGGGVTEPGSVQEQRSDFTHLEDGETEARERQGLVQAPSELVAASSWNPGLQIPSLS